MIQLTTGNLLESNAEALVNTVNTVGVMGKGIALMFKEKFPENYRAYARACAKNSVQIGRMFITQEDSHFEKKWIVNFPTKKHWQHPSQMQWVEDGLQDLRAFIERENIRSIAIPPLGAGQGRLPWPDVRRAIYDALDDLPNVDIYLYEPTNRYQNTPKSTGVKNLTIPRAMIVSAIHAYEALGFECSLIEIQKIAWFLNRALIHRGLEEKLNLDFKAHKYGPYSSNLRHLLTHLDGSFLQCGMRIQDAQKYEPIWTNSARLPQVKRFMARGNHHEYAAALEDTLQLIEGFESPLGMELLATIDWLTHCENVEYDLDSIRSAIADWPAGTTAAKRKQKLFSDHMLNVAIQHLRRTAPAPSLNQPAQLSLGL